MPSREGEGKAEYLGIDRVPLCYLKIEKELHLTKRVYIPHPISCFRHENKR